MPNIVSWLPGLTYTDDLGLTANVVPLAVTSSYGRVGVPLSYSLMCVMTVQVLTEGRKGSVTSGLLFSLFWDTDGPKNTVFS